ncbi:amidase [Streptomyces sp. NPDC003247]|uniref:amidase n=1 Tax=Streptomyces sp. NPDC003247 TaxID=3364677 RepID=UPI00369E4B63
MTDTVRSDLSTQDGSHATEAAVPATITSPFAHSAVSSPTPAGGQGGPRDVRRPDDLSRIPYWNAAELSLAIRRRVVSCEEVMRAHLDHIAAVNPKVNAIVALRPRSELLAEAREKDRLLSLGVHLGWMHGFPHAVKDLADVAGLPTTHGLLPLDRAPRPDTDSLFVARLRAAGAIFIGKTNTPELGLGSHTYNNVHGATGNAYDPTRTAGGSSGGAAVAVALRMVPVADGSDFMGSLRNPPGWNNVFGLRPSYGRVPSSGGDVFLAQGGVNGPIARTALDLALLLRTMSGYDSQAPLSLTEDPARLTDLTASQHGKRVAWLGDLGGYLPMEKAVMDITGDALEHFIHLGMRVTLVEGLPAAGTFRGNEDLWPTWLTYRHLQAGMGVKSVIEAGLGDLLKPEALYEYEGLATGTDGNGPISGIDVGTNSLKRSDLYRAFHALFEEYDYVVLPTAQVMPFEVGLDWPKSINGVRMSSYHRWMEVSTTATLLGAPTLAIPAGFDDAGLPIGLQVIARNHDDFSLMCLARAWEQQTDFVGGMLPGLLTA